MACNPLAELSAIDLITVLVNVAFPSLVTHKAFPPVAFVVIVPPFMVNPPP